MERYFCAVAADERDEPLFATASRVPRWVLVEQPGPWGPESVPSSRLDDGVLAALQLRARELAARVLLIRRPGRTYELKSTRRLLLADTRPGVERVVARDVGVDEDLATLPLPFSGQPVEGWEPVEGPQYLVCTQGRHDPCCAVRGRPVAAALAETHPADTWECSHVGGDRFAANVVVLPWGLYLGRVQAGDAADLRAALAGGLLPASAQVRGRSAYDPVVQAAQHFAAGAGAGDRGHGAAGSALRRVDDLTPQGRVEAVAEGRWRVVLRGADGPVAVVVERGDAAAAARLTCAATVERVAPAFTLVSLDRVGVASPR